MQCMNDRGELPALLLSRKLTLDDTSKNVPMDHKQLVDAAGSFLFVMDALLMAHRRASTFVASKEAGADRASVLLDQLQRTDEDIQRAIGAWRDMDIWRELNAKISLLEEGTDAHSELIQLREKLYRGQGEVRLMMASIAAAF